ncbi:hypothetical protein [Nocardia sp. CC227C]|uniref:hypothetical protein n=1 Tax=Nocardia sp. CC227C TaxID=3044562 RepID=UPI00278C8B02|nr:hypothetical protein [Nocardia sp. CC227C]
MIAPSLLVGVLAMSVNLAAAALAPTGRTKGGEPAMNSARLPKRQLQTGDEITPDHEEHTLTLPADSEAPADRPGLARVVRAVQLGREATKR